MENYFNINFINERAKMSKRKFATNKKDVNSDIVNCRICNGQGQVTKIKRTILGNVQTNKICDSCHGIDKTIKINIDAAIASLVSDYIEAKLKGWKGFINTSVSFNERLNKLSEIYGQSIVLFKLAKELEKYEN